MLESHSFLRTTTEPTTTNYLSEQASETFEMIETRKPKVTESEVVITPTTSDDFTNFIIDPTQAEVIEPEGNFVFFGKSQ